MMCRGHALGRSVKQSLFHHAVRVCSSLPAQGPSAISEDSSLGQRGGDAG